MSKMKTKSGAKKRFKLTATGKVKAGQTGKRHGMIKRTPKQIRDKRGTVVLSAADAKVVKRGVVSRRKHNKIISQAKGYYGRRKNVYRVAVQAVEKAGQYAYRDRRNKKRTFRALWIQRINAGARQHGVTYSQFMNGLSRAGIDIDRKVLSDLAIREPEAFKALVDQAQGALPN